jgi:group I intron endonuclease
MERVAQQLRDWKQFDKICCVYRLVNGENEKIYIGKSFNLRQRLQVHHSSALRGRETSTPIKNAIRKYGWDAFKVEVVEVCSRENLLAREEYYISSENSSNPSVGYNVLRVGFDRTGIKHRPEVIARIRSSAKASAPRGSNHYQKRAPNLTGVRMASIANTGRPRPESVCLAISRANRGRRSPWQEKAILQIDPSTKEIVKEWPSIVTATHAFSKARCGTNISAAIRHGRGGAGGVQTTAYGFEWRYVNA